MAKESVLPIAIMENFKPGETIIVAFNHRLADWNRDHLVEQFERLWANDENPPRLIIVEDVAAIKRVVGGA